MSESYSNTLV